MSNPNRKTGGIASGTHYFTGDGDQENLRVYRSDPEDRRKARMTVCHLANDVDDARELLGMLGLMDDDELA